MRVEMTFVIQTLKNIIIIYKANAFSKMWKLDGLFPWGQICCAFNFPYSQKT